MQSELSPDDIITIRIPFLFGIIGWNIITVQVGYAQRQAAGFNLGPLMLGMYYL